MNSAPSRRWPECALFALGLALVNGPVLAGASPEMLIYRPGPVAAGEWWRVFTYAFIHCTWYHLLLDASACWMLLSSLGEPRGGRRLGYVAAGIAGSALISGWADPTLATRGLCGLSGLAHGLTAVTACELVKGRPWRTREARWGLLSFAAVVGKAGWEASSGQMAFSFLHFGLMGSPVAVAHAGGIIGALLAMLWYGRPPCWLSAVTSGTEGLPGGLPAAGGPLGQPDHVLVVRRSHVQG